MVPDRTAFSRRRPGAVVLAALLIAGIPALAARAQEPPESAGKPQPLQASTSPLRVVFSGKKAMDLGTIFCWITNLDPAPHTFTVWEPTPKDIERLEGLLPGFLHSQKTPPDLQPLNEYDRQYAGIVKGGKKTICGNFLHSSSRSLYLQGSSFEDDILSVDDGGAYYFHIQFDLETETFWVSFNGYA